MIRTYLSCGIPGGRIIIAVFTTVCASEIYSACGVVICQSSKTLLNPVLNRDIPGLTLPAYRLKLLRMTASSEYSSKLLVNSLHI
ncbi:hypothetical protein BJX99DRAFT_110464 [Aspergillus californicus]